VDEAERGPFPGAVDAAIISIDGVEVEVEVENEVEEEEEEEEEEAVRWD
jgi:hypothetical protein